MNSNDMKTRTELYAELKILKDELEYYKKREEQLKDEMRMCREYPYIYKLLFHTVNEVYYEVAVDGTILDVSPAIERISRYSREDLLGKPILDYYAMPEQRADLFSQIMAHDTVQNFELLLYDKNRAAVQCQIDASLIRNETGEPHKVVGLLRDYSKDTECDRLLMESEEKYRNLVEMSIDGIFIETLEGQIIDCNAAACSMFGYSRHELLCRRIHDLVTEEYAAMLPPVITEDMTTGGKAVERVNKRKDGTLFPTEIDTKIVTIGGQKFLLAYVRDITERKMAEAERENLIRNLQQMLEEVKTLRGFLPICANCKNIRTDEGYWLQIEHYISTHTNVQFSHSICPDCMKKLYSEFNSSED